MASRYEEIEQLKTEDGRRYMTNVFYPDVEESEDDIYVIATEGDRYDKLSLQFYGIVDYWWIIAVANFIEKADSLAIEPGTQIRIPANPEAYRRSFRERNSE